MSKIDPLKAIAVMRICYISCVDSVDDSRAVRLMATMANNGHHQIIAIMPSANAPVLLTEGVRHIPLPRISRYISGKNNLLGLLAALLERFRNTVIAFGIALRERPEVCHCQEPDSWMLGVLIKLFTGASVVVNIREIYEERAHAFPTLVQPQVQYCIRLIMCVLAKFTDYIIHVSEARGLHYSFLHAPSVVIACYPVLSLFRAEDGDNKSINEFVVIHAGPLRQSYASQELLMALEKSSQIIPNLRCIVLGGMYRLGKSCSDLAEVLQEKGVLVIHPQVPYRDVIRFMKMSHVGLSLVLPVDQIHILAYPRKLFEYLAVGLPVIGADVPDIRRVIVEEKCGLIVDASSSESIAGAIITLAENNELRRQMAERAYKSAEKYQWSTEAIKLIQLYTELQVNRQSRYLRT